ncbi:MAG: papain-like cysteine protease family protein [Collinsella sp.]
MACLAFVYLGSCASHGSAGLEPTAEEKLLKAPVAPGYSFAFSTPRSQWSAGTMPHIYQIDPAWSELPYAGGTIRQNGCGPTCLTMIYIFKTGRTDMTPVDMCALSEAGNYAPTGATEWSFMTSGAAQLGLNGTQLYNDRDSMVQALRSGAPVIAVVRPGTFTNVGHYIVLYGIDDADQIGVYDPNSPSRSARRWGIVEVLNEIEAMWAYY